ncbi:hypothetical protein CPLU01_02095 [Colletotrichum plurivorum]|uniref:Uncharacterized protein n=1 Tax=Colletotrichum plurivorum TaxID=2175906 RepID=A0A8H6KY63_9PEZI|nr:hypothetical protein CPLU01_02095 [Colletotrichum plurivorum]
MSFRHWVTRDRFIYNVDGFMAVPFDGELRPRQSDADLRAHFRSLLTDSTGVGDREHGKHWYEAQLRHYGLEVPKFEADSKYRLMEAVMRTGKGGLTVPAHIATMEQEMKAEWDAKEEKMKKAREDAAADDERKAKKARAEDEADTGLITWTRRPATNPSEGLPGPSTKEQIAANRGRHRSRFIGSYLPATEVVCAPSPDRLSLGDPPTGELFPKSGIVATDFAPHTPWRPPPCWSGDTNSFSFSDSELQRRGAC